MGLFGNQGSTKSSSSSTTVDNSTIDSRQANQGDAFQLGANNKGANQRLATGGYNVSGDRSSLTIKEDLSAGVAHDSIQGVADVSRAALMASAAQSSDLAALAQHQNSDVLSAVSGRAIGGAGSYVVPLTLGAVVIAALFFMGRK